MGRRVHVLEVVEPSVWGEVESVVDLAPLVEAELGPRRRAVRRGAERAIVPALRRRGLSVLVRAAPEAPARPNAPPRVAVSSEALTLLHKAQRRAIRGVVLGARVWHPIRDRAAFEELVDSGLIASDDPAPLGAWRLHPALGAAPEPDWDLDEALFDPPEDLEDGPTRLVDRVHDAASLAAAIRHVVPRRTHLGHLDKASCRQLGRRLHDPSLVQTGDLHRANPRWVRALDLLVGLDAVEEDPLQRILLVRHAAWTAALAEDWLDRIVRRTTPPDVAPLLGALRVALRQAGPPPQVRAVDEIVLLDLLAEQQNGAFAPDAQTFRDEEGPLLEDAIGLLHGLGLVRRGPGALAPTEDGLRWAGFPARRSPIWISSDLEIVVPPDALTPLERYGLERLALPVARDVVDRLCLDRAGLADWLVDGDLDQALALLHRLGTVPGTVVDTLTAWAASLTRVVLVRDVELPDP